MKEKIYVVMGSTGEYSDRTEWSVCAYADKALAEQHVQMADACAKEQMPYRYDKELVNPFDPGMIMDYTGTYYYIYEVPVRTELPVVVN